MINTNDRSNYFGASDVGFIIGNWETKTFENWWLEKLGLISNNFTNEAMQTGSNYEHKILDSLGFYVEKDKQIIIEKLKLRVNYDGTTKDTVYEVKTYNINKGFKVPISYKRQVWVQMYAGKYKNAFIVAYGLTENDYKNCFNEIDQKRLSVYKIDYNEEFINEVFLPKLKYLTECLTKGKFPNKIDFEKKESK